MVALLRKFARRPENGNAPARKCIYRILALSRPLRVALFGDSFHELNGVGTVNREIVRRAEGTVVLLRPCRAEDAGGAGGIGNDDQAESMVSMPTASLRGRRAANGSFCIAWGGRLTPEKNRAFAEFESLLHSSLGAGLSHAAGGEGSGRDWLPRGGWTLFRGRTSPRACTGRRVRRPTWNATYETAPGSPEVLRRIRRRD